MPQPINIHQYKNGLVLLTERMDWVESAAFSLLVPAGSARDPGPLHGLSSLTCEMVQRGCGPRDSHQLIDDLENLGVDHSASVSNVHTSFGGAMPADQLESALSIFADLVRSPHLPEDQLEDARSACVQEIRSLEDDLAQQVMQNLRQRRYGNPFGRNSQGTIDSVQRITLDDIRDYFDKTYRPNGAILSVAGKIDFDQLKDHVGQLLESWESAPLTEPTTSDVDWSSMHLAHKSHQTHIGVAYESVPYCDKQYYQARAAVGVLSDGMSSRLFTEIRENRGLCYSVYAVCHTLRDQGSVFCYAGTTSERSQETLDVLIAELLELRQGIRSDELARLKARLKSALIMQQESSASRCGSIAADWYFLNRVQTLDEVGRIIDDLTCESINAQLTEHPPERFTVVTLGQNELELPVEVL